MKFIIRHEIKGRMRVHLMQKRMTCKEADTLLYYLQRQPGIISAEVYERTGDAVIYYDKTREARAEVTEALKKFRYGDVKVPDSVMENSGRELNARFQEKLLGKIMLRCMGKLLVPFPVRASWTGIRALGYLGRGINSLRRKRLDVAVLDGTAIGISLLRKNMETAASIMFLLSIGELLEEWTRKKSVGDLARSMSLNISKVWALRKGQEVLTSVSEIQPGDEVVVRMGNVIPFDGNVTAGEAMVNQASFTGESLPVRKKVCGYVYAGTVVEEGELTVRVRAIKGSTRFEKIVAMIEESEKLKSSAESKAEHLADRLVPYTLAGTVLTGLLTRNVSKALAVLMVDFSCALKLSMPITVLSAIREAGAEHITVKGGKYMEAVSEASTIVFDKTGTLTKARPTVKDVVVFTEDSKEDMLRIAACLEEHFPHSMAKAVVQEAKRRGLEHEEMHSKVEYTVAHGISSWIDGRKVVIGSAHFVFEDEKCVIDPQCREVFEQLPKEYSHLYLAIEGRLAAVICIEDPLREEAREVLFDLRELGLKKIVMMTGDSERTAAAIAARTGVDEYYSEVLPEDKARFVEKEKAAGRKVIMIGDGINDSPALSAADVGIAVSDGAQIAREIADITITADDLYQIVTLKRLSDALMKRIHSNYRWIVGVNAGLILLGVGGLIQPATSALFHNTSTLLISLKSMRNLLH